MLKTKIHFLYKSYFLIFFLILVSCKGDDNPKMDKLISLSFSCTAGTFSCAGEMICTFIDINPKNLSEQNKKLYYDFEETLMSAKSSLESISGPINKQTCGN